MTLSELRKIHEAGTKGPWANDVLKCYVWSNESEGDMICEIRGIGAGMPESQMNANAHLIVTARNMLPVLLDIIELQREALRAILKDAQMSAEREVARLALEQSDKLLEEK